MPTFSSGGPLRARFGATTSYLYDNLGRQKQVTLHDLDGKGTAYTSPIHETGYDSAGNVAYTIDPLGGKTFFEYDNLGRQTQVFYPLAEGTPVDHVASEATKVYGLENWTQDKTAGMNGSYRYATAGTTGTFTHHAGPTAPTPLDPTKTYQVFVNWVASPENSAAVFYNQYQDGKWIGPVYANQQIAPSDYVDANGVAWHRLRSFTGVTDYHLYVDAGNTQPNGSANRVVDDGFMLLQMDSSTVTKYDAAGNVKSTTDQMGRVTDFGYDNWDRQISVEQPDPDGAGTDIPALTRYEYDANGNLRFEKLRTDDGPPETFLTTEHQYDHLNRKIKTIDANGDPTTYQYDKVGNLTKLTDAENNETVFAYYDDDRLKFEGNELGQQQIFQWDGCEHRPYAQLQLRPGRPDDGGE
jgi:YD repeat-containing protein